MKVKFIVISSGVILGDVHYDNDYHADLARRHNIKRENVLGGGIADLSAKTIYGTSYGFGPYDPIIVKKFLPDWKVNPPSDY